MSVKEIEALVYVKVTKTVPEDASREEMVEALTENYDDVVDVRIKDIDF